jgi:hypothetical protein
MITVTEEYVQTSGTLSQYATEVLHVRCGRTVLQLLVTAVAVPSAADSWHTRAGGDKLL